MIRKRVSRVSTEPERVCGHARFLGHCPCCQRQRLARWNAQLAAVKRP